MINFRTASFYAHYSDVDQSDNLYQPQIAFAGRSNSGKSSLINALCDNKKLARTSQSPGRTQALVMFALLGSYYLTDLPGYGYAKMSKQTRNAWKILVEKYIHRATQFGDKQGLRGLVIVIDSRRLLQDMDRQMLEFAHFYGIETCLFLTKTDKLKQQQKQTALQHTREALNNDSYVLMGASTPKKQGIEALATWISTRLIGAT